jgi:ApaG protein
MIRGSEKIVDHLSRKLGIKPGETFEYSSWTRIDTPVGQMRGTFFCMTEEAYPFETPVAEFALVYPGALH